MPTAKVGVREFRENLSGYLESAAPVAIMRHGKTLGFYVPAPQRPQEENLEALRRAGEQLDALIVQQVLPPVLDHKFGKQNSDLAAGVLILELKDVVDQRPDD